MGCLVFILFVIFLGLIFTYPTASILIGIVLILFGAVAYSRSQEKAEEQRVAENLKREEQERIFKAKKIHYNISDDWSIVTYKKGYSSINKTRHYIWISEDNNLSFFPAIPQERESEYAPYKIPVDSIEYFATGGEIFRETKITGGGGEIGGSSIAGAVVGGVIAGGAGAVIGSRKKGKIEEIKSETITHDERETFINFFVNGEKHSMFFNFEDYNAFLKLLPNKEYDYIQKQFIVDALSKTGSKDNIINQIKELAKLKESGILTEEEFNEKKKILLDKIS